jgi:hypothetical protein
MEAESCENEERATEECESLEYGEYIGALSEREKSS